MVEFDAETRRRLEAVVELVSQIAEGADARLPVSRHEDELDAVVAALNMLAEDFAFERRAREQAEHQLRDVIEAYEHAPGLFVSVSADDRTIIKCNATLAARLGRTRESLVGQPLDVLYLGGEAAVGHAFLDALLEGAPLPEGDHALAGPDDERLIAALSGAVVKDQSDRMGRVRLIYRDVTRERELNAQLLQSQKLETVGRLAGGIAHDFNNILTAVFGFSATLRAELTTDDGRADLDEIEAAARRAADLTRRMLAFSRQHVVMPVDLEINGRLRDLERLLRRSLGEDVLLRLELAADAGTVTIDPTLFEQVVLNLCVNARDAMADGGHLALRTSRRHLDHHQASQLEVEPGPYACLEVIDTGEGMNAKTLAHVFEPFFTTKPVGAGTGLGLAMAYGTIRQAGGAITLESVVGEGTTVTLVLPRQPREASTQLPRHGADAAPGGDEAILVVEDEDAVRHVIKRILTRAGYRVGEARNGEEALALAPPGHWDLIVSDAVMPGVGGLGSSSACAPRARRLTCF
jgi:two-component system cell cycle sensor histidine kinase/response regulator CckA